MDQIMAVKSAQNGNKEAFCSLIQQHEKVLYIVARSILHNDADCCDAVQDTILKAYENIRSLRQPEFFKAWLLRILVNSCNQLCRNNKRIVLVEELQTEPVLCSEYSTIETMQILDSLEGDLKLIIILFYMEDLSIKSISKFLQIPEGTVKSRLSRARNQLSRMMESEKGRLCYE